MMEPAASLSGQAILVVEDQYMVAHDLVQALVNAGARAVGPAPTVEEALARLEDNALGGAVLDLNLSGELSFGVADTLSRRAIPFVFATAYAQIVIPPRFSRVKRILKPYDPDVVVRKLAALVSPLKRLNGSAAADVRSQVIALLPQMRIMTRCYSGNGDVIESLVTDALVEAILEAPRRGTGSGLATWLLRLLRERASTTLGPGPFAPRLDTAHNALSELPVDLREALVLSHFLQLETAAVADVLGLQTPEANILIEKAREAWTQRGQ